MPVVRLFHYVWIAFVIATLALLIPNRLVQGLVGLGAGVVVAGIGLALALNAKGLLTRLRVESRERNYQMPETGGPIPSWAWRAFSWVTAIVGITVAATGLSIIT